MRFISCLHSTLLQRKIEKKMHKRNLLHIYEHCDLNAMVHFCPRAHAIHLVRIAYITWVSWAALCYS